MNSVLLKKEDSIKSPNGNMRQVMHNASTSYDESYSIYDDFPSRVERFFKCFMDMENHNVYTNTHTDTIFSLCMRSYAYMHIIPWLLGLINEIMRFRYNYKKQQNKVPKSTGFDIKALNYSVTY